MSREKDRSRLWPQTERIKAAARAASLTGDPRYWEMASSAADSLLRYLVEATSASR